MRKTFFCIDSHTCGMPVRVVAGGAPFLNGDTMMERRMDFLERYDWIRRGLMFEPRGHDMMSGSIIYPAVNPENDIGILYIEVSGCLPMCGHGTIGTVTAGIEEGLIVPKEKGKVRIETPAGLVIAYYEQKDKRVTAVRFVNVESFVTHTDVVINSPELGELSMDIAYGGNFYAIIDPQKNFSGVEDFTSAQLKHISRTVRKLLNEKIIVVHPEDENINKVSHIMWTGTPEHNDSTGKHAVFLGEKAIDRSPCGTGTSARMAQWYLRGKLGQGEEFIAESYIGSQFVGKIESEPERESHIIPSIEGWNKVYGYNTITIDTDDPYAYGFQVV